MNKTKPQKSKRESSVERRRHRVLKTARRIVVTEGVDALSMRKLAKKSNLVVKTLYNLFGSKENILTELLEAGAATVDAEIDSAAADGEVGFLKMLATIENAMLENATLFKPSVVIGAHASRQRHPSTTGGHARRIGFIRKTIATGIDNGFLRTDFDIDLASSCLYHNYFNTVAVWAAGSIDDAQLRVMSRYNTLATLHGFVVPDYISVVEDAMRLIENDYTSA